MKILVNGKEQVLNGEVNNIAELLKANKVQQPEMVSVQLNGNFLDRNKFSETNISENDEVDFVYFMGGGSKSSTK